MAYTNIDKGSEYFETKLYTGTGAEQSISSLNFSPDLTWIKVRSNATHGHNLFDTVRGVNKPLSTESTSAEGNDSSGSLTSFNSDGFTLGGFYNKVNQSGETFVSWNWRGSDSSAASNTDGSITSTVSANTTSGFSIVSYTGTGANATVGHSLGSVPKMIIWKNRSTASNWQVYHHTIPQSSGEYQALQLNLTNASAPFGTYNFMNATAPTSSVFSLDAVPEMNGSGNSIIAYCFAEKKGFSKFGSYTGNGSADGTFVYTGFKPAMVIFKETSGISSWYMFDNKLNTYNVCTQYLRADISAGESTFTTFDMLSNGFKIRNTDGDFNGSGSTYIYMAFAENPFVTSTGIPTCAR